MAAQTSPVLKPIRFPVLSFGRDGEIYALDSLDPITRCTRLGFNNDFYRGLLLVDSDRLRHRVLDARRVRTLPPKRFGDLLGFLTGNPHWQVDFVFEPGPSAISLEDVKRLIASSFKKDAEQWEEMTDFEDFRDETMRASSMSEIFAVFTRFSQMELEAL